MALEYTIDTIEGLDENVAKLYTEKDGKFILDVSGVPKEDVSGLKSALEHERENRKKATDRLKQIELEAQQKKEDELANSGDLQAQLDSAMGKIKERDEKISGMEGETANEKRNNASLKLAAELADGKNVKLLSKHINDRLRFVDGEIKVLDEKGDLTVSSIADLKSQLIESGDFDSLLKGNKSGGGGAGGGDNGGGAANSDNPWKKESRNLTKQAQISRTDPTLAAQLKKAAGV